MEPLTLLPGLIAGLSIGLVVATVTVLRALRSRPQAGSEDPVEAELAEIRSGLRALTDRLASDAAAVGGRLEGIDSRMTQTQTANQDLVGNIFSALSEVKSATATVADQAREFNALQDLLKPPKPRGAIGEAMLEELLRQVLPAQSFETQYRFRSGTQVDAIVKAGGRLIPIDSKFPLTNFVAMGSADDDKEYEAARRAFAADVDKHIKDISVRYIVPDEGTLDFAVMYVPADGVYGEVLRLNHRGKPLFELAIEARVIPMSPLTMFAYLQTVLFGLRCLSIEERAGSILNACGRLEQDLGRFSTEYETLGRHLGNARSKYEEGTRRLDRFRDRLEGVIELGDDETEPDAPSLEVVGE